MVQTVSLKTNRNAIEMLSEMYNIKIISNFSTTSHGKGPLDGVGATLNRIAADTVRRSESIMNSPQDFYSAVMDSSLKVICILVDEFQVHVENLGLQKIFESVQPIPDITKYHYIEFENKNVVLKKLFFTASKSTNNHK